jgi:hypothetical protein
MKAFQSFVFDPQRCRKEVAQLRSWLARRPVLQERKHIQPFCRNGFPHFHHFHSPLTKAFLVGTM